MAKQNVTVELYYSGVWHTAPAYVRDPITITRGRGDESSEPTPQTLSLTLDNRSGDYNPRNVSSPLYGLVGRNTPIRVSVDGQVRFHGEVSSWKPDRTVDFNPATGKGDAWTEVEAAGTLRRIGQGADVLASPLRRAILGANPTAYWTLEDLDGATQAESAVDGVLGMQPFGYARFTAPGTGTPVPAAGLPKFGTGDGIPGSASVVDLAEGGVLTGDVPVSASAGWRIGVVMVSPRDKADAVIPIRWDTSSGTYTRWELQVESTGLFLTAQEPATGVAGWGTSASTFNPYDGLPHYYEVEGFDSGGNVDVRVYVDDLQVGVVHALSAPNLAGSVTSIKSVTVNPLEWNATSAAIESMPALGHVAVWNAPYSGLTTSAAAMTGHSGETTAARFLRLCDEEGITASVLGDDGGLLAMGAQRPGVGLAELLAEVERTDGGMLYEPRDSLGVVLRSIPDLYGQAATLTVDWSAKEVAPPFEPVVDDLNVRNDVTAKSATSGGQAQSVEVSGPMSVQPPPAGVGRYSTQLDVNPAADSALADLAAWARHKGTVDEVRLPRVTVDLVAAPGLTADAAAVDIGDRITVSNLPADVGAGEVSLIVLGYTETIGSHRRSITYNGTPSSPYDVATVDGDPRVAADGTTLAAATPSPTWGSFLMQHTAENGLWTTDPADFPLLVMLGGELVSVSGITTTGPLQQNATGVTRSLNGVVRTWPAGTPVDVAQPAVLAL